MSKPFDISLIAGQELRFLTKQITTYNNVLIDSNELKRHVALSEPQEDFRNLKAQANVFSMLPVEVFFTILEAMDIESVFRLRATSVHLKALIESWTPFRIIMKDARLAVKALIATKASKLWTMPDLQTQVYTTQCEYCGEHGEILHLLKLKRVCFNCVTTNRQLLSVSLDYATFFMGLSQTQALSLPHLQPIRQARFWGNPKESNIAVDYTAAVELATTKLAYYAKQGKQLNLPNFLLNAPESSYVQHACCTYFPALELTDHGVQPMKATLCAGCVYYWNYHSSLPYQCLTLYRHDHAGMIKSQHSSQTQLQEHLASCTYAAAYWQYLYLPALNHRDTNNPFLASNGGQFTRREMCTEEQVRLISLLDQRHARFLHFHRHEIHYGGQASTRSTYSNLRFEEAPDQLLQEAQAKSVISCRTGLDLELEAKKNAGDVQICNALSDANDWQLNKSEQMRIARVREQEQWSKQHGFDFVIDTYGDALLGSTAPVSQSNWALAKTTSSQSLFGGWARLMEERKWKQAEAVARDSGRKVEQIYRGIRGWGMDRFGCVSNLA